MLLTAEQNKFIKEAGQLLKKAFPDENLQFCFNLAHNKRDINYNMKSSGIMKCGTVNLNERKKP